MAYIKFKRNETNEGSSLLLPVEGISLLNLQVQLQ